MSYGMDPLRWQRELSINPLGVMIVILFFAVVIGTLALIADAIEDHHKKPQQPAIPLATNSVQLGYYYLTNANTGRGK